MATSTTKGFDSKCGDLADHFLHALASKKLRDDLAQSIQDAVEDWFDCEEQAIDADIVRLACSPAQREGCK